MTVENEFPKKEHEDTWPGSVDLPEEPAVELEVAEWTQVDTPGSAVELEKVRIAAIEDTVQIPETPDPEAAVAPADEYPTEVTPADPVQSDQSESEYQPKRIYREPEPSESEPATSTMVNESPEERTQVATHMVEAVEAPMAAATAAPVTAQAFAPVVDERSSQEVDQERALVAAETARAEAERAAAERQARNRALGVVDPTGVEVVAAPPPPKLVTDRFVGACGLFLFRFILAIVLGVRGYQMITDIGGLTTVLEQTRIPQPQTMAWVAAISTLVLALSFLLGIMVRVAGFGLLTMMSLALAFIKWGPFQIFQEAGFLGELEFILAGVGLVFLCLGGGRWGIDGSFRAARTRAKENREG